MNYSGLHPYTHHLNSSQLLCMMFFSAMIKDGKASELMVEFIKNTLDVEITTAADCEFEYTEEFKEEYNFELTNGKREIVRDYEGTSFDFHIQDSNTQIFFEVKLTENGFGKADDTPRHLEKSMRYIELLPDELRNHVSTEDMLNYYQLFRNIIRTRNEGSYVVFITDGKNPATNKEIADFSEKYSNLARVKFMTWQEVKVISEINLNLTLPFQFKALM